MRACLSIFVLAFLYATLLCAEPRMLDRLIVEINGRSFSQRQIEVFYALRTIAAGHGSRKALPDPSNWKDVVEQFKNEMLVYTNIEADQQRMDSFQADQAAIQAAQSEVQKAQLEDSGLPAFFRKLGVTEAEIQKNIVMIFRIQAFVRSRVQVATQEGHAAPRNLLEVDGTADWFTSLLRTNSFRLYDHAKEYQLLGGIKKESKD